MCDGLQVGKSLLESHVRGKGGVAGIRKLVSEQNFIAWVGAQWK